MLQVKRERASKVRNLSESSKPRPKIGRQLNTMIISLTWKCTTVQETYYVPWFRFCFNVFARFR